MKRAFIFIFIGTFIFFSCSKKTEKKEEKKPTEQVVDSVQTKDTAKKIKKAPELVFTVQVAALKRANPIIANLSSVQITEERGLYKYRLESFESYEEAKKFKSSIQSQYSDAFIQALKNGKPISIQEALK